MKVLVGVLGLLALGLALLASTQLSNIHKLQAANLELTAKLTDKADKDAAEAKVVCSDRAQAVFQSMGYSDKGDGGVSALDGQTYTNHYNPLLKRCLMELTITGFSSGTEVIQRSFFDADERTDFGEYSWVASATKKYWEQKPVQCKMTPPGKEKSFCHSTEEWEAYVKSLMT